jgi:hypothetical protein
MRCLIRDRDSKYSGPFDEVFRSGHVRIVKTPVRSPKANAVAERFVRTVRSECLDWLLILSRRHLEHVLRVYAEHYSTERPHGAAPTAPTTSPKRRRVHDLPPDPPPRPPRRPHPRLLPDGRIYHDSNIGTLHARSRQAEGERFELSIRLTTDPPSSKLPSPRDAGPHRHRLLVSGSSTRARQVPRGQSRPTPS